MKRSVVKRTVAGHQSISVCTPSHLNFQIMLSDAPVVRIAGNPTFVLMNEKAVANPRLKLVAH